MHLERPHRSNHNDHVGNQPGGAAFDVEEFLHPHIRTKARLREQEVAQLDADLVSHDRGVAVRNVGKRPGMDEGGLFLQRL